MTSRPATPKQIAFLMRLLAERKPQGTWPRTESEASALDIKDAGLMINSLLAMGSGPGQPQGDPVTEPGLYRKATATGQDSIYKVQRSKQSGGLYAKVLMPIGGKRLTESGEVVNWEFQYDRGAIRSLRASDRMTLEQAKAFGIRFGVCCVCGRTLVDAESVAQGIGPVCAGRFKAGKESEDEPEVVDTVAQVKDAIAKGKPAAMGFKTAPRRYQAAVILTFEVPAGDSLADPGEGAWVGSPAASRVMDAINAIPGVKVVDVEPDGFINDYPA